MNPDPNPNLNPNRNNPNNLFDTIILLGTTFGSGNIVRYVIINNDIEKSQRHQSSLHMWF